MAYSSANQQDDGQYNNDFSPNMESYVAAGQANHGPETDYQHASVGYATISDTMNHSAIPQHNARTVTGAVVGTGAGGQQGPSHYNSQRHTYSIGQHSPHQEIYNSSSRGYPGLYNSHHVTLPKPSTGTSRIFDPVHPDRYHDNRHALSSGISLRNQGASSTASRNRDNSGDNFSSSMWPLSEALPAAAATSTQTVASYGHQLFAPSIPDVSRYSTIQSRSQHGNSGMGFATQPGMPTMVATSFDTLNQESSLGLGQNGLYHTSIHTGPTDPLAEVQSSSRATGMNVLPPQDWRYPPWSGHITDLQSAEHHLWRHRKWTPANAANDRTIPRTEAEIIEYARRLYSAMVDFDTGFSDKIKSENKLNRLVNRLYSQLEIEARCYQIVILTKDLHENGSVLLPSSDITFFDPKGKAREDSERARGSEDWKVKPGAQSERDMSFADRWDQICLSVQESKATATDLLDGKKRYDVIYAPGLCRKVKKSNKQNNDNKQDRLAFAKRAEESGVAVSSGAGGNNRRKRARAPEVNEEEYDSGQGPSSRKRAR